VERIPSGCRFHPQFPELNLALRRFLSFGTNADTASLELSFASKSLFAHLEFWNVAACPLLIL